MTSAAPIMIGSMVPLTGSSANDGREFRNGLILAIEEVNARGGILGRPLEAVFIDTGNQTAGEVVRAARQLISRHRVSAIINGYDAALNKPGRPAHCDKYNQTNTVFLLLFVHKKKNPSSPRKAHPPCASPSSA